MNTKRHHLMVKHIGFTQNKIPEPLSLRHKQMLGILPGNIDGVTFESMLPDDYIRLYNNYLRSNLRQEEKMKVLAILDNWLSNKHRIANNTFNYQKIISKMFGKRRSRRSRRSRRRSKKRSQRRSQRRSRRRSFGTLTDAERLGNYMRSLRGLGGMSYRRRENINKLFEKYKNFRNKKQLGKKLKGFRPKESSLKIKLYTGRTDR